MTRFALTLLLTAAASLGAQAQGGGEGSNSRDVPTTHRPPPGMCRIWIDGVPPGRQPAPTDCATAIRRRPPNARVVFGDEVRPLHSGDTRPAAQVADPRSTEQSAAEPRTGDPHPGDRGSAEPTRAAPPPAVRLPPRSIDSKPRKPPSPKVKVP